MTGKLLDYYDKLLERLENIEELNKKMIFKLLKIEDKETLELLIEMDDKSLIKFLSDWLEF